MTLNGTSIVTPISKFRTVKDAVGNITLQPPTDDEKRAAAFRSVIYTWIEQAKDAADPVRDWFTIGPIEARVLLSFSKGNRREPKSSVAMYARDIESGAWKKNPHGFAFSRSGWLGDGHHRCKGVIASEKSIRIAIDFGVDDDALGTIDMGRARSVADQLALGGQIRNAKRVVAAVRMCMTLASGRMHPLKFSFSEVVAGLTKHRIALEAMAKYAAAKFPASFWGTLIFAYPIAPEIIDALAEQMVSGARLEGPALTLREYVLGARSADPAAIAQRTLYAVRAILEHRPLVKFSPRSGAILPWFTRKLQEAA